MAPSSSSIHTDGMLYPSGILGLSIPKPTILGQQRLDGPMLSENLAVFHSAARFTSVESFCLATDEVGW